MLGVLLALMIVLAVPPTSAGDEIVLTATYTESHSIDPAAKAIIHPESPFIRAPGADGCQASGQFTNITGGFRFDEAPNERGCGEARFSLNVPPRAPRMLLSFSADRSVDGRIFNSETDAVQALRVYNATWSDHDYFQYFDPNAADGAMKPVLRNVTLGNLPNPLSVGWWFEDRGGSIEHDLPLRTTGQNFSAHVRDLHVSYPDIPLPGHTAQSGAPVTNGKQNVTTHQVHVELPDAISETSQRCIKVTVSLAFQLVEVRAPSGRVAMADDFTLTNQGSNWHITLDEALVEEGGPGAYYFTFQSYEPAVLQATPMAPNLLPWLPWATGAVPLIGLAVAFPALGVRRTHSVATNVAWRNMWAIIIIAALVSVGALAIAVMLPHQDLMRWPGPLAASAVHIQWLASGIIMLVVAAVGSRQIQHALKEDNRREREEKEAMERINKELERFAYVASHDLQEPLRKIISLTQLVQSRYKGQLDSDADEFLGYAANSAVRMRSLVQDLLKYSRLDVEAAPTTRVDTDTVLANVLADLDTTITEAGATIDASPIPAVAGHQGQFGQVLQNLISNAIKYRHPDRAPIVKVSATQEGRLTHIRVADNGLGISERHQARIFEIFQRLHSQSEFVGTGIGLSLVRKIVDRHGGRVWVESVPGEGSMFHVIWPSWRGT